LHCPICFFLDHTATTPIHTLSLHDALPILPQVAFVAQERVAHKQQWDVEKVHAQAQQAVDQAGRSRVEHLHEAPTCKDQERPQEDRKSTRLNSSHLVISYAVFCLKKKKKKK